MRQIRRKILHKSINQKGLELLRDLFQDNALILLECDKNPGWSLDTCSWYNQEYVSKFCLY